MLPRGLNVERAAIKYTNATKWLREKVGLSVRYFRMAEPVRLLWFGG